MADKEVNQVNSEKRPYLAIGKNIKATRNALGKTIQWMCDETGISRGYISDFERGVKLPTGKYINFLFDKCNVNLNFLFSGEGLIFRPVRGKSLPLDFGNQQEQVEELVWFIHKVPHALFYHIQAHLEYKLKYKQLILEHFPEMKNELL